MKYENRIMEFSLLGCVFFTTFELAASFSYYLLEVCAVSLAISLVVFLTRLYGFNPFKWSKKLVERLPLQKGIWIFLVLYIIWDIITLFYSPIFSTAISKYKVIILMALIVVGMVFYCNDISRIKKVLIACGSGGIFTAVFAVINIFIKLYPIYYTKRLSLRVDYNMFAVTVFTGFITAFLLLLNTQMPAIKKAIYTGALCAIVIPAIVLSASRRTFLLLAPTLLLFWLLWILTERYRGAKNTIILSIVMAAMVGILSLCLILGIRVALSNVGKEDVTGIGGGGGATETDALDRYEDMSSGSLFQKRSAIWLTAIDEIKTYDSKEILFGKGNAFDIYFYDVVDDERLNSIYDMDAVKGSMSAHNFLIADMMNGGILKLIQGVIIWVLILKLTLSLLISDENYYKKELFKVRNNWITSHGIIYSLVIGNTLINSLISNRFGFIYDRFFFIFLFLALIEANIKGVGEIQWKK